MFVGTESDICAQTIGEVGGKWEKDIFSLSRHLHL